MTFAPSLRRLVLTLHVVTSVGWLGAVVVFLGLAIAGLASSDAETVRAVYVAMGLSTWLALVPLALASLTVGIVNALGTSWGLIRHHWVLFKLLITIVTVLLLLQYTQTLTDLAGIAREQEPNDPLGVLRTPSVVLHASLALGALIVTSVLSVYKPKGLTRYGRRKQREQG